MLVIDDEKIVRSTVGEMLRGTHYVPEFAVSGDEGLEILGGARFDVILSDVRMPGRSGIDLVREIRAADSSSRIVLMTGFGSIDSAVDAIRAGALDYITKPFKRDQLLAALDRAVVQPAAEATKSPARPPARSRLIGSSAAIRAVISPIEKIAASRANVLITGESGTGKELVARMIHESGSNARAPFVPVNCSAIPEGLLESELFGHARGAFTGACTSKAGLFEVARGGTLFLDEVGDLQLSLQAKLLRTLQDKEIRRVGDTTSIRVEARVIAATHKNLWEEVGNGRFREDLFYRLNVVPIHLPPLRTLPGAVRELTEHFLREWNPDEPPCITPEALATLERMPWRGNVRELQNMLERALILGNGKTIDSGDLVVLDSSSLPDRADPKALARALAQSGVPLREIEDRVIEAVLEAVDGNKVEAARVLGISRRTIYRRGSGSSASCVQADAATDAEGEGDAPVRALEL